MNNSNIIITGSIVYDRIMSFPGFFKDHVLPDKIHILNVCFAIDKLKESFGGTGGNIAYGLSLLDEKPILLGVVGNDFGKYEAWLEKHQVDISKIKKAEKELTASAYITTDKDDNQITAFHAGSLDVDYCQIVNEIENVKIAIVSPDYKERMIKYVEIFKEQNIPYIFDPGQQITSFSEDELEFMVKDSKITIGNDYEIQLIQDKLQTDLSKLKELTQMLIITKGAHGSEIISGEGSIEIKATKVENAIDPTGAGDAYRSGLIKGIIEGWDMEKVGGLASTVASYAVQKYGTQEHKFDYQEILNKL